MQIFQFSAIALLVIAFFAQTEALNARKLAKEALDVRRAKNGVRSAKSKLSAFNKRRAARWAKLKSSGLGKKSLDAIHKMNERIEDKLEKNLNSKKTQLSKERADVTKAL